MAPYGLARADKTRALLFYTAFSVTAKSMCSFLRGGTGALQFSVFLPPNRAATRVRSLVAQCCTVVSRISRQYWVRLQAYLFISYQAMVL